MAFNWFIDRRRLLLLASVVGLAALVALTFGRRESERDRVRGNLNSAINAKLTALKLELHTFEPTSAKATRVRNAIKHEDYSAAGKIVTAVLVDSHLENWRFHPFTDFIDEIADLNDSTFRAHLDAWVARNDRDATPLLIRAEYNYEMGWGRRGHNFIERTPTANLDEFQSYMNLASSDIEAAIRLDASNPYSFCLRLRILRGSGFSDKAADAFQAGIARYPGYYPLYETVLSMLQPKWGGSVESMYAFVDRYAGQADEASPLRLLYPLLYRYLLETASTPCSRYWPDSDKMAQCTASGMQAIVKPALEHEVVAALQLYDRLDKYQFSAAIAPIVSDMAKMAGGGHYVEAMLELAALSMHSDTQLKHKPDNNNFMIDEAVAESWRTKGFYDNALQKEREALRDVETMAFPSKQEKNLAIANIYQNIAETYSKLNQHVDLIAYEKAAIALGSKTEMEYFICYGYYQLKDYADAIDTCTKAIDDAPNVLPAYYWRGAAYRDSGGADAALRDLTVVADSQNNVRSSAAIDMSMIYFGRDDYRSALNVLNKYQYLYDPEATNKQNVAVSYNNRCYARMQLGELKDALSDCTASLKYGNIPDAFHKKQELIERLHAHEVAL
jgi:tetratricopeptide (TPR) repeat protein